MRREPTEPEQRMWLALRAKRFANIKFRRQKVVGPYIVDFAAREPMLAVELDGDSHSSQVQYDAERTAFLERHGYRVVRFTNADVMGNLEGVLTSIGELVGMSPPLPTLSPEGERAQ
jgi:very-short-patch-repair endonuclease